MKSLSHSDGIEFAQYKAQKIKELIPGYNRPSAVIVDLGCGDGLMTSYLKEVFFEAQVIGFDKTISSHHDFNEPYGPKLRYWDEKSIPLAYASVDCLILSMMLHHVPWDQQLSLLKECTRVLKAGGSIIILELNPYNLFVRWRFSRDPEECDAQLICVKRLEALAHRNNLLLQKKVYMNWIPSWMSRLMFLESWFSFLPLGSMYSVLFRKED